MIDLLLVIPILASFLLTLFLMPFWIRKAHSIGLSWNDMNKIKSPKVAGSGGIMVVLGFLFGCLIFVAYRTFYLTDNSYLIELLSMLLIVCMLAGVGLVDDLFGWQKGGLSRRSRILFLAASSIPLMAISAGKHIVSIPFIGPTELGLIYPLILIPLGVIGATSTFNFLAGFNGLEAGQGIILLSAAALVSYFTGHAWLAVVSICMIVALFAFLIYNFFPAKVFPGDVLTYPVGGLFAIVSIIGNFERIALFFFIPYIIEFILKSRGKLVKYSFGMPNKDGTLDLKYPKIYGMTHLSIFLLKKMNIQPTEKKVVYLIWAFQIVVILIGLFIFRNGIILQ